MARLGDTTALEKERRILDEQLGIDAKAVNDLIARNARVAQDQKEYNERYDALVSRYEETEHKRDAVMEQIDQIMIRRRKIERFIESVKDLPGVLTSCASIRFPHTFGKLSRSAARPSPIKTCFADGQHDGAQQGPDRVSTDLRDGDWSVKKALLFREDAPLTYSIIEY